MPQILKSLSLYYNPNHTYVQKRRKPSVSSPILSCCNKNLQASEGDRIFYNVIQDYLPVENRKWIPTSEVMQLNVEKGDIVQFLRVHENNTVLVKKLNRLEQGLVPLRCLSINVELTKLSNPSSPLLSFSTQFESINRSPSSASPSSSTVFDSSDDTWHMRNSSLGESHTSFDNSSSSIAGGSTLTKALHSSDLENISENTSLIKSVQMVSTNISSNRVWYRIDIVTPSGHKRYLRRHYHDFYQLHNDLICEFLERSLDHHSLPILPKPVVNTKDQEYISARLKAFTNYLETVVFSDLIPLDVKNSIVIEKFCGANPGDIVQTPRGSFYTFKSTQNCPFSWRKLSVKENDGIQDLISYYLTQDASSKSHQTFVQLSNRHSSNCSSRNSSRPNSQPNSPQILKKMHFSENIGDEIKMKVSFSDDCYVLKCQLADIDTWQKLVSVIHSKLIRDIPDPNCPLKISYKPLQNGDTISLDETAYDIEKILFQQQNPLRSNPYAKCNTTTSNQSPHLRQCFKINFNVGI